MFMSFIGRLYVPVFIYSNFPLYRSPAPIILTIEDLLQVFSCSKDRRPTSAVLKTEDLLQLF